LFKDYCFYAIIGNLILENNGLPSTVILHNMSNIENAFYV